MTAHADTLSPPVPAAVQALYAEGLRRHRAGDLPGAAQALQQALQQGGEHPGILEALALVAGDGNNLPAAEKILRRLQALRPTPLGAVRLALAVFGQQRYAEAAQLLAPLSAFLAGNPDLANTQAIALERSGEPARGLELLAKLYRETQGIDHARNWLGAMLRQGRQDLVAANLGAVRARHPADTRLMYFEAEHRLANGDLLGGYELVEQMDARNVAAGTATDPLSAVPRWDGLPFDGTLLVRTEPHIGEEIMLSTTFAALANTGQRAVIEVDARMVPLYARSFPTLRFVASGQGALQAQAVSGAVCRRENAIGLCRRFRPRNTLPAGPAWLVPDAALRERKRAEYEARWPGRRLVGISWRSARQYERQDLKSVPLAALSRTLATPGVVFIDIQYGDYARETAQLAAAGLPAPWRDPEIDPFRQLDAFAAQLAALDQVVCVSNTTAHLAGALGVPVTVLLPQSFPVLWHWGYTGTRSAWYASAFLLRNPGAAGFAALDTQLAERLATALPDSP